VSPFAFTLKTWLHNVFVAASYKALKETKFPLATSMPVLLDQTESS
jgi:hypothetical protein